MTCLGVLERGERDNDNGTSLKEGGLIEMSTTVLSIYAMLALFRLKERGGIEMSIYSAFPYTRLHSLSFASKYLLLIFWYVVNPLNCDK